MTYLWNIRLVFLVVLIIFQNKYYPDDNDTSYLDDVCHEYGLLIGKVLGCI